MRLDRAVRFRELVRDRPVVGPFSKTTDPAMIEVMGLSGFDFLIMDMEHGPHDVSSLGNLIRAAESGGMLPIVRVRGVADIGPVLDLGAGAVQIPHVDSAEGARRAVDAAKFAPQGHRGVCRYVRAACHSTTERSTYFRTANDALVIAQVEGRQGVARLDEILEVDGIDIIFVGVYDLSQAVGRPGEVEHPDVQGLLDQVCRTCRDRGRAVGTFVESVQVARKLAQQGVHYLCYGVDIGLMAEAARSVVAGIGRPQ
jgi:4-hydroxy-2-oxoheptanedioate aldolase